MKTDLLRKIRMHHTDSAVARVKIRPGEWQFLVIHPGGDTQILPTEFGMKMVDSPLVYSMQAYTSDNGAQACEAWVFTEEDYDTVWMSVVTSLAESPRPRAVPVMMPWWRRLLRLA